MADLSSNIEQAAAEAKSAASDGQSAEAVPIADLIAADHYLAAKASLANPSGPGGPKSGWNALRPARVVPPGAV